MGSAWPFLYGYFSLKMVLMLIHVYSWYSGFHLNRCRGIRPYLEWIWKPVSLALWNDPRGFLSSFNVRPASSWGVTGMLGFLFRQSRGIDPYLKTRRGKGAEIEVCQETRCSFQVWTVMSGNVLSCIKGVEYFFDFQEVRWEFSWDAAVGKGLISCCGENPMVFLEVWQEILCSSQVVTWTSGSRLYCLREVRSDFELWWASRDFSQVTAGEIGLIQTCVQKVRVPLQWRQGSQGCIPGSPGESGLILSWSKELCSPLELQQVSPWALSVT